MTKCVADGWQFYFRSNDISWGNLSHSVFRAGIYRDDIHALGPG